MRSRVVVVDLGQTKTLVASVDEHQALHHRLVVLTETENREALLDQLANLVLERLTDDTVAVGIAVSAGVESDGSLRFTSALPLEGFAFTSWAEQRFGVPAVVENDANAATVGEHRVGAGRGADHLIMITVGTGIGGGVILNGRLYRGAFGQAGELGHLTIDYRGDTCLAGCAGHGHLESLASGTIADRIARELATNQPEGELGQAAARGEYIDARLAATLAVQGDGASRDLFLTIAHRLAFGIASYVYLFDPELIIVGGGLAGVGDLLFPQMVTDVAAELGPWRASRVQIVPASLGIDAGVIGIAHLAHERTAGRLVGQR